MHSLRVGWRNLFSSCAVVSVFCSGGKQVLVVHATKYLEFHTVVVLCQFFLFWREIVFGVTYVLSVQYSCAVVSFFLLWRESYFCTNFLVESEFSFCAQVIFPLHLRSIHTISCKIRHVIQIVPDSFVLIQFVLGQSEQKLIEKSLSLSD